MRRKTEVVAENVQILYRPEEYRNLGKDQTNRNDNYQDEQRVPDVPQMDTIDENDIF
jgi:hypothetical protein